MSVTERNSGEAARPHQACPHDSFFPPQRRESETPRREDREVAPKTNELKLCALCAFAFQLPDIAF